MWILEGHHSLLISTWTLSSDYNSMGTAIQLIPYSFKSPSLKPFSLQFSSWDAVRDHIKKLAEMKVDDICNSSFFYWCNHFVVEGPWVSQVSPLSNHLPLSYTFQYEKSDQARRWGWCQCMSMVAKHEHADFDVVKIWAGWLKKTVSGRKHEWFLKFKFTSHLFINLLSL